MNEDSEKWVKWLLGNAYFGQVKPNTPHAKVKIELVNGNTNQRVLTYKANTTTIYAVYPSLCSAPVCWAGRVDSSLSRYPHEIAFVGVTIEEAANEFKRLIDCGEDVRCRFSICPWKGLDWGENHVDTVSDNRR